MEIIEKNFNELTDTQRQQLAQLDALYREWNAKINVISRKDIDNLYEHHVLHSLPSPVPIVSNPTHIFSISEPVAVSRAFPLLLCCHNVPSS